MSEPGPAEDPLRKTELPPTGEPPAPAQYEQEPPAVRARRFWSARRVPAGLTALLLLAGTGLLLYDTAAVRAGQEAMAWRKRLADELATRPLGDAWVITGAAAAAVLGLWLILLAVTPGLRAVLPMRRRAGGVRAGIDRRAAGLVLRDRAMEVSGVRDVRVAVGRRKVATRAEAHFRELDQVRAELETALAEAVGELGLARPLRLAIQVRSAGRG